MKKRGLSSWVRRRVTVVVSDSIHCLHLVEVDARVRYAHDDKVDVENIEQVKAEALQRVALSRCHDPDAVGVLVSLDHAMAPRGRIVWARDELLVVDVVPVPAPVTEEG